MSSVRKFGFELFVLLNVGLTLACASHQPTRLCDGFSSYETVETVRARLGSASEWTERFQGTSPDDKRPPYKFTILSGQFKLYGVTGRLKLTFYNGNLMETEFWPEAHSDFVTALQRAGIPVPKDSGIEVVVDRRTRFRFDYDPDGKDRFLWYDPLLEKEWSNWVKRNS